MDPHICPHCKKPFDDAALLGRNTKRAGYKCPNCNLFIPVSRAPEQQQPTAA